MNYPLFCVQYVLISVKKTKIILHAIMLKNEEKMKRGCAVVEGYYYE